MFLAETQNFAHGRDIRGDRAVSSGFRRYSHSVRKMRCLASGVFPVVSRAPAAFRVCPSPPQNRPCEAIFHMSGIIMFTVVSRCFPQCFRFPAFPRGFRLFPLFSIEPRVFRVFARFCIFGLKRAPRHLKPKVPSGIWNQTFGK